MDSVNKTLYIPLCGKALVSRRGVLLHDPKAEEIWQKEGFSLKGKAGSKWLAFYMAMRAAVMDRWTWDQMKQHPDAVIVHLGCGLDSRCLRLDTAGRQWYDVDFPEVIRERRKYYAESDGYRMISGDIRTGAWTREIPRGNPVIVVMEGVSMYLKPEELGNLFRELRTLGSRLYLLTDCYSSFGARASRYKNPVHDVGVKTVYALDDPEALARETGLRYVRERDLTPTRLIRELSAGERIVFTNLYAGRIARSLYKLYEFEA